MEREIVNRPDGSIHLAITLSVEDVQKIDPSMTRWEAEYVLLSMVSQFDIDIGLTTKVIRSWCEDVKRRREQ